MNRRTASAEITFAHRIAGQVIDDLAMYPSVRMRGRHAVAHASGRQLASKCIVGAVERTVLLGPDRPTVRRKIADLERAAVFVMADADPGIAERSVVRFVVEAQECLFLGIAPFVELPFDRGITLVDQYGLVLVVAISNLDRIAARIVGHVLLGEFP